MRRGPRWCRTHLAIPEAQLGRGRGRRHLCVDHHLGLGSQVEGTSCDRLCASMQTDTLRFAFLPPDGMDLKERPEVSK